MSNNYHRHNSNHYTSFLDYLSSFPIHLCFFMAILVCVLGFSWYINYESMIEDVVSQVKLWLVLSPLLLLLVVHWLSSQERERVPFYIPLPEKESLHRAGGSPWGVAVVLVFLFFMISNQSSFHERWFPLGAR